MGATISSGSGWNFQSKGSILRPSASRPARAKAGENLKHFDEGEFVRKARAEAKRKQALRERRFVAAIVAAIVALIVLAAHLTYEKVIGFLPELNLQSQGLGAYKAKPVSSFQLAGVSTGMTPKQVQGVHDDSTVTVDSTDITIVTFTVNDATVQVSHLGADKKRQAFRIRTQQTYTADQEQAVMTAMAHKFGRSTATQCDTSSMTGTTACRYQWRADSIDLKAHTRLTTDGRFIVNLNAEDVRLRTLATKAVAAQR